MARASAAAASDARVARHARDVLAEGNAIDAVVAGVLLAAADADDVLLGPVQILIAGGGAGLLAVDGRVRQPGKGARRPRGLLAGETVSPAARVGAPGLPAALATALAACGSATFGRLVTSVVEVARERSPERAGVLEALARRGPPGWMEGAVLDELTAVAGRSAGGILTREDIDAVRPDLVRLEEGALRPPGWLVAPWAEPETSGETVHVVVAADERGRMCAAVYERPGAGLPIPALGLVAPAGASPVLRGSPRARPGSPCPAAAPIGLRFRDGVADMAVGIAGAAGAHAALLALVTKLGEVADPRPDIVDAPGRVAAVARSRDAAAVLSSA